jgi:hypothetical protein
LHTLSLICSIRSPGVVQDWVACSPCVFAARALSVREPWTAGMSYEGADVTPAPKACPWGGGQPITRIFPDAVSSPNTGSVFYRQRKILSSLTSTPRIWRYYVIITTFQDIRSLSRPGRRILPRARPVGGSPVPLIPQRRSVQNGNQ